MQGGCFRLAGKPAVAPLSAGLAPALRAQDVHALIKISDGRA